MDPYPASAVLQTPPLARNKVFWLSLVALVLIATTFWTQSRVPALNQKAEIGNRITISAIAFDIVFPVSRSQPLYERTWKSAANWAYTNWKGMSFGFLAAAAFITLLQSLPRTPASRNRFLNSLIGLGMGSPLGVCVNCATPIAQGMIHAGTRLETSLAALSASPTLNPIVLSIAFSLLPLHLVLVKLALSVLFILLILPLLIAWSGAASATPAQAPPAGTEGRRPGTLARLMGASTTLPAALSWPGAMRHTGAQFAKNLFYIVRFTLPLMLVAGLAGSLLIELLPRGSLSSLGMDARTLLSMAAIGCFLPVPIAFDVLIVNLLLNAGLNTGLAATLLFTLGIFSLYPALIIARSIRPRLSLMIFVSVTLLGVVAGVLSDTLDRRISQVARASIEQALAQQPAPLSLADALAACRGLGTAAGEQRCLSRFLMSETFLHAGRPACTLGAAQTGPDEQAALALCRQVFDLRETREAALEQQDIGLCARLSPTALADRCRLHYITRHALEYPTLAPCQQLSGAGMQRYCRAAVMGERMRMKTPAACELQLGPDMQRQCLDNLQAHIASGNGTLSACAGLSSDNARRICRSTVVSLKITSLQDYGICDRLQAPDEARACRDQVLAFRATQEQQPSLCRGLSDPARVEECRIDARIRRKQAEVEKRQFAFYADVAAATDPQPAQDENADGMPAAAPPLRWTALARQEGAGGIIRLAFHEDRPRAPRPGPVFQRLTGDRLGLDPGSDFGLTDFMEPFLYGKGIASGDFDRDGWPDLALAGRDGVRLYRNLGNGRFAPAGRVRLEREALNTFVVALVDLNNDGWLDVFLTAYGRGAWVFYNHQGRFPSRAAIRLPETDSIVALAAAFGDPDRDGDLDLVLGNWSYGAEGAFIPEKSHNVRYRAEDGGFEPVPAREPAGETLSLLLSDINHDGRLDLVTGNDRKAPDIFYLGTAGGGFRPVGAGDGLVPETSMNTMSYDTADFNNDLLPDLFSTDMFVAPGGRQDYCAALDHAADRTRCQWLLQGSRAIEALDVGWCAGLPRPQRASCYTAMAIRLAKRDRNPALCRRVSDAFPAKADFCRNIARRIPAPDSEPGADALPQRESNKLLLGTADGRFTDATLAMGVKNSFWGWTGKAADLDNDGWQDIYIGNGLGFGLHNRNIHSNIFYHNREGRRFEQEEQSFGLDLLANTPSYTYLDLDLDGDLDIVATHVLSTPTVFLNQGTRGNSISFELRDENGNRYCIGCKLVIHYRQNHAQQMREIKAGGGFLSFDAPVAHFGLADATQIDSLSITWSTGETWEYKQPLRANRRYRITRGAS